MRNQFLRALVVAPHPDDEVLGAGIWMYRHLHCPLHILHITDGSPRDMHDARALGFPTRATYAAARRREAIDAVRFIGIPEENCLQLSIPDKEACFQLPRIVAEVDSLADRLQFT